VCKLDDIWQLHRSGYEARSSARTMPYILDLISAETRGALRDGRCFLLFDLSGEGHPFIPESFEDLHGWCNSVGLRRTNVGLVSQNRAISVAYNHRYGAAGGIKFFNYDWILNAIARMFAAQESEFLTHFRFAKTAPLDLDPVAMEQPFLCINAQPRPLRVATLAALSAAGLLPRTRWSLLTESAGKGDTKDGDLRSFLRRVEKEDDLYAQAIGLLRGPEKRLDDVQIKSSNQLIWSIDYQSYRQTCIALVTETEFTEGQVLRVTEKSVKALAMGRPAMVFGNPQSLVLMREFGFQTFHPLIDETYDETNSASARFRFLCDEITRVDDTLMKQPKEFIGAVMEIGSFNADHARNGGFLRAYKERVELSFWRALSEELGRDSASCQK
jgi:hypothetical protein